MNILLASASTSQWIFLGKWEFHLRCNLNWLSWENPWKVTDDRDLGLHTARARLGVLSGCQQMKEGEVRGSEKWERSWTYSLLRSLPIGRLIQKDVIRVPRATVLPYSRRTKFPYHLHDLITHRRPIKLNYNLILSLKEGKMEHRCTHLSVSIFIIDPVWCRILASLQESLCLCSSQKDVSFNGTQDKECGAQWICLVVPKGAQ